MKSSVEIILNVSLRDDKEGKKIKYIQIDVKDGLIMYGVRRERIDKKERIWRIHINDKKKN